MRETRLWWCRACVRCSAVSCGVTPFCGWGVLPSHPNLLRASPLQPKGGDSWHPGSVRIVPPSPEGRAIGIPSTRSPPLRAKKKKQGPHSSRVSSDCMPDSRVETVSEITAPPLPLHLVSHSLVNPRSCKKSQHPRSFGPRPRSFTFRERSSLPAHSRTCTQVGRPRRLM